MTCVFHALIQSLKLKASPHEFLYHIKQNNTLTRNVLWNSNMLEDQELQE